jgi:phosphatidylglycerophosphatase A
MSKIKELLFTGLYSGYFPFASGTAGTIVGVALYILLYIITDNYLWQANFILVLIVIYPSFALGSAGADFFDKKDPSEVVLDEIIGFWISILFFSYNWYIIIAAFFIFRFFDILKPYPCNELEKLEGGYGIMLDDYMAGIYTNLVILFSLLLLSSFDINFGIKYIGIIL